jgi:D-hydroxyproline dehydrogenase subunit beta
VTDVAIIGAGIVGAACAHALTEAGASVVVIELAIVGGGATAAGMGHIVVMDDSPAQFALTNYSTNKWNQLSAQMPADVEYEQRGTLWVAADEQEMDAVRTKHQFYTQRGVRTEILNEMDLRSVEPNLRQGLAGGLLVTDDAVVYAPRAAAWLLSLAVAKGARLEKAEVTSLSNLKAANIVCAAGDQALRWFPDLDIKPRKGHLAITQRYPGFVNHQLIELGYLKNAHGVNEDSVAFNVQPRATGQVLIGSSRQFGQTHSGIDPWMMERMLARAIGYMPSLAGLEIIRTWTGFRAATSDHLPIIGRHPEHPNVYLATGHEGLGITTSLGTAHLITSAILGRPPLIDPHPYLPGRRTH